MAEKDGWRKAALVSKLIVLGMLVFYVLAFVVRNRARDVQVDWVLAPPSSTNVAMVIFVSLVVGAVVGVLVLHLARRR